MFMKYFRYYKIVSANQNYLQLILVEHLKITTMKNYAFRLMILFLFGFTQITCQSAKIWYETNTPNTLKLKEGVKSPDAKITDMDWYVGRWVGKGFGGDLEENFGPAMGNSMIGSFRMVQDGTPIFYEFIAIIEENGTISYKLKHFNSDLTGWEEKDKYVTFPLVKMGNKEVWFDGLTIKREDNTTILHIAIEKNGKVSEEKLVMQLAE